MIFKFDESFILKAEQKTSSRRDFVSNIVIFYPFRSISKIKKGFMTQGFYNRLTFCGSEFCEEKKKKRFL